MVQSLFAMPIIVISMGGEMIYILNQRLKAQTVPDDKAEKVLLDVLKAMYTSIFLDELFKPQKMYTMELTKGIFDKLAHSSIMRLNKTSMDKLFDLMTMGFKREIIGCLSPQDYIIVTLNHLETIKLILKSIHKSNEKTNTAYSEVMSLIQSAEDKLLSYYSTLSQAQWMMLKQSLFRFLQNKRVKVSLFLQTETQKKDGSLILPIHRKFPYGVETPGVVRYYDEKSLSETRTFEYPSKSSISTTVLDLDSTLGLDIYQLQQKMKDKIAQQNKEKEAKDPGFLQQVNTTQSPASPSSPTSPGSSGLPSFTFDDMLPLQESIEFYKRVEAIFKGSLYDGIHNLKSPRAPSGESKSTPALQKLNSTLHNAPALSSSGAKMELNYLADLLGVPNASTGDSKDSDAKGGGGRDNSLGTFRLSLFPGDDDFFDGSGGSKGGGGGYNAYSIIEIDGAAESKTVDKYMRELDLKDNKRSGGNQDDDDDLLALMDSVK